MDSPKHPNIVRFLCPTGSHLSNCQRTCDAMRGNMRVASWRPLRKSDSRHYVFSRAQKDIILLVYIARMCIARGVLEKDEDVVRSDDRSTVNLQSLRSARHFNAVACDLVAIAIVVSHIALWGCTITAAEIDCCFDTGVSIDTSCSYCGRSAHAPPNTIMSHPNMRL
jgi:hypothetical protein